MVKQGGERSTLVVVSNGVTPYGLHFLKRVAIELTEVNLKTIFSYEHSMGTWKLPVPPEINATVLGAGEFSREPQSLRELVTSFKRSHELIRWLEEVGPSAIMLFGYGMPPHRSVLRWASRKRVPVLLWGDSNIRGDRSSGLRRLIKRLIVRRLVAKCRAILCCGRRGREYFRRYGAHDDQIFYVPNEPDYQLLDASTAENTEVSLSRWGIDLSRRRMVFSGRLVELKRVDWLIRAFDTIADERSNWDLLIIGDGPCRLDLERLVPARLASRVIWTGFINDPQTIAALYRVSDLLVLPSNFEAWALVVNEAAAAGLAIVCSDVVGAAPELVRDGVNGYVFPVDDFDALKQCMLMASDPTAIDKFKATSPAVLREWRAAADPVEGLRKSLMYVDVLS